VGDQAYISWIKTFESSSDSYIRISLFSNNNGWSVPVTSASNLSLNQTLFSARIPQNVPIIGGEYLFVVEVCNSSGVCSQYDSSHFTIVAAATSTIPAVTSSSVYTLNVNYDKFDSEEAQNHYVSVYSDSGTKSAAITVFKFNDSATMTADQIKTKLASLGYRPATLDETYALGQAGKWSIVGLGTLLGSYNVYPYTMVGVANNLYSSAGPFDTQTFSFAGVSLGASVSNPNVTIGTCSTGQSWNGSACAWTVAVDNSQHSTLDAANGDLVGQNIVPPAQTQTVLAQNTVATSTVAVISVPPASTATSDTYTLNIDYSHFASEESQYHYTSVYSSTGTKSTAITVFKFTDSSTMTADQVKTKLASLGYRPATLDETYALGQAGKWNVIGLGTSMGSFNVYPLTLNGASTGLYNIGATAAYSTQLYKFAAVKL